MIGVKIGFPELLIVLMLVLLFGNFLLSPAFLIQAMWSELREP